MCGRYQIVDSAGKLTEAFQTEFSAVRLRYNVGPMQRVPIVLAEGVREMRWGFQHGPRLLINARGETVHRLPAFKEAFRERRCLVPASGYYEWHGLNGAGKKQPYLIRRKDHKPLALAGLWETDRETAEERMVIVTNDATPDLAKLHDRMPLWLAANDWEEWFGAKRVAHSRLADWQERALAEKLETMPVSTRLNSVRNDDAECLAADVPSPAEPDLFA